MAGKPLTGDFGLVLSVLVVVLCLMSLINTCSSRTFNTQNSEIFAAVVGAAECLDCDEMNIKHEHAFKGLQIAIKCKTDDTLQQPYYKIEATSELNPNGDFVVKLPADLIGHSGELTTQCLAQLHDASNTPCPQQSSSSNIILLQSKLNSNKLTYSTSTPKLPFSSSTCTSAFLLHKFFHHPIYKKPIPSASPYPTPVYKPKPCPPIVKKSLPPPSPVYTKPIYVPKYPPVYKKPLPPIPKFSPVYKKPLPPIPKFSPVHKKPIPTFPPHQKFKHPSYHGWPPLPPFSSHHPNHPYFPPSKEVVLPSP